MLALVAALSRADSNEILFSSCNHTIEHLLIQWKLQWREIPLDSFSPGGHHLFGGWDASMKHEIQLFEIRKYKGSTNEPT